jgi:SAM-dependent methyltransferase
VNVEAPHEVVHWHDVECGGYGDDLAVWAELAETAAGDVLDLGCGTGRVALHLAAEGRRVWAVDVDQRLLDALASRAEGRGLDVEIRRGDCRSLDLGHRFALAIAPMQLVQILGGAAERRAFFLGARDHLLEGGLLAVAIVEGAPALALTFGADVPPDIREVSGWVYSSQPVSTRALDGVLEATRLRQVVSPDGDLSENVHVDRLDLLDAPELEAEGRACGLDPSGRVEVPAGLDHVGSIVVLFERPRR